MKEKEQKIFFSRLFAKPKADCCNVQFEEINDKNDNSENLSNKKFENTKEQSDNTGNPKKNKTGGCCT